MNAANGLILAVALVALGVPAFLGSANNGFQGGKEGHGLRRTWLKTWGDLTLFSSLLFALPLVPFGIVTIQRAPLVTFGVLVAVPVVFALCLLPITALAVLIGYNFGAQRRAQAALTETTNPKNLHGS